MTSAGHALVAQLEAEEVRRVYCVPGESYLDVLDGLYDSSIETIVCRQEGGAGFMALAEARLTRRVGVAAVTRGPGAANAAIAVHTAYQDATPLVLLVGLIPVRHRYRESFQEFDLHAWFGTTAKAVRILDDPDRAPEMLRDAVHLARSGRPGPVVLGLPEDVLVRECGSWALPSRHLATGSVGAGDIARARGILEQARRPVVVLGGDQLTEAGSHALRTWVEDWRLPVVTDFRTQDQLDDDSPSWCGWLGYGRCRTSAALLDEADAVFFIGDGSRDALSDGFALGAPGRTTVLVGTDPDTCGHHGGVDLHVLATPDRWAAAWDDVAAPGSPSWAERTREAHDAVITWSTPHPDGAQTGVDLGAAMQDVRARLSRDAIVTCGAGNHAAWAQRYLPTHSFPSVLAARNGAMGFELPAAVAAALVRPDRQVISIVGDGCFLMNGQELATAVAYGARLVVLVVDNGQYGTIRAHQERHYPGRVCGTRLVNPDFGALARSFGAFSELVDDIAGFAPAFERAAAHDGPAVLHLRVAPDLLAPARR